MAGCVDTSFLARHFALDGRVALVTGASGGIGAAIAGGIAASGATVTLVGRDAAALKDVQRRIDPARECSSILVADLADVASCRGIVAETVGTWGGLDIVINCAGTNRRTPIIDVTPDDYDMIMAVNLRAAFFVSQAAARVMMARGGGKIVNIGSLTFAIGLADVSVYGASKAALAQLSKSMAVEWAEHNIQVNCLTPGFIRTPLTEEALWGDEDKRRWMLDRIPMRRHGVPDDLVGMTLLLVSPASDYVTGQTMVVDGGFLAGSRW